MRSEDMKKQALISAMLMLAALPQGAAGAEPTRLVTPLAYGTHLPGLGTPAKKLARLIEERSGGALELELKEPGDGTRPQEILDNVAVIRGHGKHCGLLATDADNLKLRLEQGFRVVGLGMDAGLLIRALKAMFAAAGREPSMNALFQPDEA